MWYKTILFLEFGGMFAELALMVGLISTMVVS